MFKNVQFKTGVDYYHRLNLVFNLMIAIPLLPFSFLYLASLKGIMVIDFELTSDLKLMIDGVFTSLVIGLSYYTFHQYKLERRHITSVKGLRKKLTHFYNCLVRSYLYLVIGGCISVIGYLITYGKLHIVTFVVLLVLFSLKRPTLKMIVEDLELVGKELDVLRNKEEIEI